MVAVGGVVAVIAIVAIAGAIGADDEQEDASTRVAADASPTVVAGHAEPEVEEATTTTYQTTTTVATTTTTIDPEVLRAEYDAQVAESCERVATASLARDDSALASAESVHYDTRWTPHAPRERFLADVEYCGHQRREERRAAECGARPDVELLNRDPDRFTGQCFTVVFSITQFDQGTGPCGFRARFDTAPREWNFEYKGDNSIVMYDSPCPALDAVGTDDVVRIRVVVLGGLSYDTTIGGTATAVQFQPVGDPEVLIDN